jgi:hypothetical protein
MGCSYANKKREIEQRLRHRCAFCRELLPNTPEEGVKRDLMKRVKADDPMATVVKGIKWMGLMKLHLII